MSSQMHQDLGDSIYNKCSELAVKWLQLSRNSVINDTKETLLNKITLESPSVLENSKACNYLCGIFNLCWIFRSHLFWIALFNFKIICNNEDPSSSLKFFSIPKCGKVRSPHLLGNRFQSSIFVSVQWFVGLVLNSNGNEYFWSGSEDNFLI